MAEKKSIPSISIPIQTANGSMEWAWYLYLRNLSSEMKELSGKIATLQQSLNELKGE